MSWFDSILSPIMWVVAWIMVLAHRFFEWIGMDSSGWSWILSIVVLVVAIRVLLIPLFVRQIKASRGLQLVQPEIQKLQKKYKGKTDPASRQAMQQEMMAIYREAGTNPFSSCLPILAQSPIFFALFRVLYQLPNIAAGPDAPGGRGPIGPLNAQLAAEAEGSSLFGAPLSSWFLMPADQVPDGSSLTTIRIIAVILIIAMSVTTFTTQRQLTMKNMPATALDNPMARQQKTMMYILPLVFAFSGVNFPIGVLIYWTTTNLWSMGQQFYTIRNMPAPGSEAEKMYQARKARRDARRARRRGFLPGAAPAPAALEDSSPEVLEDKKDVSRQREQPMSKKRAKKKGAPRPGQDGQVFDEEPEDLPMTVEDASDSLLEDAPDDEGQGSGGSSGPGKPGKPGKPGSGPGKPGPGTPKKPRGPKKR